MSVVQLSSGPLTGRFSVLHLEGVSLVLISTNQMLLINGDRGKDLLSFSLEITGNNDGHRVQCQSFDPFGIYGFNQNLREAHFQLGAGSMSLLAIISTNRINNLLTQAGLDHLIDLMLTSNSLSLAPDQHRHLCHHFLAAMKSPPITLRDSYTTAQTLIAMLIENIQSRSKHFVPLTLSTRSQLVREFVNWGTFDPCSKANLDEICEKLYTSRRTLILGIKDNFDCGPMELLRTIRLQQVHSLLRSPEARRQNELHNVSAIAEHYGFRSRGHFARSYRTHFNETPRATLINSLA